MYEFLTNAHAHRAYSWKTFICGHCLSEFDSFSDLMSHITSIGSAKKYTPDQSQLAPVPIVAPCREYPCSLCSAVFKTATAKLYHEVTHTAANKEDMCKQLKLNVKYLNAESPPVKPQTSGRRRKILAADPSEICLGELQEKKKPQSSLREEEKHKKDGSGPKQPQKKLCKANTPTGRKQLNTLSSLSPQKKQELVSIVYCNRCEQKFMSLKLLDKHYWSQHPNMDIPLDLTFEVGSGDVTPRLTPCSVCAKRTACVKAIQQLLDEALSCVLFCNFIGASLNAVNPCHSSELHVWAPPCLFMFYGGHFMTLITKLHQSLEVHVAGRREDKADWLGKALEEELTKHRCVGWDVMLLEKLSHLAQQSGRAPVAQVYLCKELLKADAF
ncbi:hypothetical protein HPB51_014608 [Rhipicephalus microplus]|uniref:C2H2-type domain-containing protein n=1 Tax=Rhipicephalus microplus TaxID=6941 RepID=A0A9J6F4A0_RHIMP|nr:hypothetical protein HPB51_014608 [Rhipicephalus microplus]